ncbi:MAG: hypothetical protein CVU88_01080 [Firmicutes bacterium HGW-Firmicutes-13]|nr:MAG: hypothetical protein CVU88_01080 [Firmicutes bacterium HGW-Firmicutes-13]
MTERAHEASPHSEYIEGNPLYYLPAAVLPGAVALLSGELLSLKVTGSVTEIGGKEYFEITKIELIRR